MARKLTRIDGPPALKEVFTHRRLVQAWKKTVRTGLRSQPVVDLHDYLDYHRSIDGVAKRVQSKIIDGMYRPRPPEVVTLEKSNGICRRIVMPAPEDALSLQALVDFLEPLVESERPSPAAFYSRSHNSPSVDRVDGTFSYPWWILWPEFQKRIWGFSQAKEFTVVTDVASYYDTIPLANLRQQVAKLTKVEGPTLDFLFFILETFVWRPDYIPHPGVGLPQINFDTPRLLAHAYLYPADVLLVNRVGKNFVRWMDDIDFGVDSRVEARALLRDLDQLLGSYGVRLNAGKTKVLSKAEAAKYFWISDNRALGIIQNLIKHGSTKPRLMTLKRMKLEKSYEFFQRRLEGAGRVGHWNKVKKRYLGLLGMAGSPVVEAEATELLSTMPDLRSPVLLYLSRLGYSPQRFDVVEKFIREDCIDDTALFAAVQVLVDWSIPATSNRRRKAADLGLALGKESNADSFVTFVSGLWLMTKYASLRRLWLYIKYQKRVWSQHEWAARQVAAVSPRFRANQQRKLRQEFVSSGQFEGLKVLDHLGELQTLSTLDNQLSSYLMPEPGYRNDPYPLSKVLITLALLRGELSKVEQSSLRPGVSKLIEDPVYRALLQA